MSRRPIIALLSCLLLGAVVNVAVSWAITWWRPGVVSTESDVIEGLHEWPMCVPSVWPKPDGVAIAYRFGAQHCRAWIQGVATNEPTYSIRAYMYVNKFGFPLPSLYNGGVGGDWGRIDRDGIRPPRWLASPARGVEFPISVIPLGFIFNTLFYAAILYTLTLAPFHLRRALRRRRNLCPKCAYPIGASAICTECGATLPAPLKDPASEPEPRA